MSHSTVVGGAQTASQFIAHSLCDAVREARSAVKGKLISKKVEKICLSMTFEIKLTAICVCM